MQEDPIIGLFKFGKREHLEQLRRGSLFLNTLSFFARLEASDPRQDPWEGTDVAFAPGTARLSTRDQRIVLSPDMFSSHLRYSTHRTSSLYVYCLYAVISSRAEQLFEASRLGFGDSWVLFSDGDQFLGRVRDRVESMGFSFDCQIVEYVNEDQFSGPFGPFRKRIGFQAQSEARIVISPGGSEPMRLDVGDLSDVIDPVREIGDLQSLIRITRESPGQGPSS